MVSSAIRRAERSRRNLREKGKVKAHHITESEGNDFPRTTTHLRRRRWKFATCWSHFTDRMTPAVGTNLKLKGDLCPHEPQKQNGKVIWPRALAASRSEAEHLPARTHLSPGLKKANRQLIPRNYWGQLTPVVSPWR